MQQDGAGYLSADLPFDWTTLELRVAAFQLREADDPWFGYEIVGMRWPDVPLGPPDVIDWLPLHSRRPSPVGPEAGEPGRPAPPLTLAPDADMVDVAGFGDPGPGQATEVLEPGAGCFNQPLIVRMRLQPSSSPRPKEGVPLPPVSAFALSAWG